MKRNKRSLGVFLFFLLIPLFPSQTTAQVLDGYWMRQECSGDPLSSENIQKCDLVRITSRNGTQIAVLERVRALYLATGRSHGMHLFYADEVEKGKFEGHPFAAVKAAAKIRSRTFFIDVGLFRDRCSVSYARSQRSRFLM